MGSLWPALLLEELSCLCFEHEQLSHNSVRVKLQHWPGMESSVSTTAVAALFCHLPTGAWREENSEYTMKYTTGTYPCPKLFCTDYSDTWVSEKRELKFCGGG